MYPFTVMLIISLPDVAPGHPKSGKQSVPKLSRNVRKLTIWFLQRAQTAPTGAFKNTWDIARQTAAKEGVWAFYKG